ncbi:helix-turn-helix transcriptional regulator [Planomonospora parontospora]|uniref:helix-turn-helix transcriptional regulator n=1 Tax=Planomonospora parontospora TaxID=58119 RepID=UPI0019449418|nr:response regulator transcription factor [Planomonospora parontospora]GGL57076.1 DNA-binding response regulator [Planomonospora parontospora subsp. antibiotica]GII20049.1 DNA-binding response regulator [Planomonospora parontospora subsp. antibiotica]
MTSKWQSGQDGSRVALLALGSEVVRCGLRTVLYELETLDDVLDGGGFDGSMELLHSGRPTLLVLGGADPVQEAEKLARAAGDFGVPVLLMLRSACDQALRQVATVPADGYLLESEVNRETLMSVLTDLDSGLVPMPLPLARKLMATVRLEVGRGPEALDAAPLPGPATPRDSPPRPPLSRRELEVLGLMAEGLSNKQIARGLGISEHGAKRHVANILAKLNCSNRTLATTVALSRGLVRDPGPSPRARRR